MKNLTHMDKAFEKIYSFEESVLQQVFPNARLAIAATFGSPDKELKSFDGLISNRNIFKNTIYEYTGENKFIHFTSLPKLSLILNSGFLRMSDFNCLYDKSEFSFSFENIFQHHDLKRFEDQKEELFCLSACESNSETISNKLMWKNYGDNGQGCVIEYKFSSEEMSNFNLGIIQYGKKDLKPLKKLNELATDFSNKNNSFKVNDFPIFIARMLSFHKQSKYSKEKEVRLLFHRGGVLFDKPHLNQYKEFFRKSEVRNFIKIYLKGKNPYFPYPGLSDEEALSFSPQIEVIRVIIGPEISNLIETIDHLEDLREYHKMDFEIWRINDVNDVYRLK